MNARPDKRADNAARPLTITPHFLRNPDGSALVTLGETKVLCAATLEERSPAWLMGSGKGWITAEYSLLPPSTPTRVKREAATGKVAGRTHEIQRLIGRSLRAAVDLTRLKEHTITLDCDVIQADGGTRTAAITGSFVALALALRKLEPLGMVERGCLINQVVAISCGIVDNRPLLDLTYEEDSQAMVDMNFVMTADGRFVEMQGTGEGAPFDRDQAGRLTELAFSAIPELVRVQREALGFDPLSTSGD